MKKTLAKEQIVVTPEETVADRKLLRYFCREKGIKCPDFFVGTKFIELSSWAVKRNVFPMAVKTCANLQDGNLSYILKGFREISEVYDSVSSCNHGEYLIEDYVSSKARIEVCFFNGRIVLVSQIGLEKSIHLRHAWRAFPITLPSGILKAVERAVLPFESLLSVSQQPLRFSFAVSKSGLYLLSLNEGFDRPEYSHKWCQALGIPDIVKEIKPDFKKKVCKTVYIRNYNQDEFSEDNLINACEDCYVTHDFVGRDIVILLASENPEKLQKLSRIVI